MMMDKASAVIAAAVAIAYLCSYFKMHGIKQTVTHAAIWVVCIGMSAMLYTKQSAIINNEIVASIMPGHGYHTPQKAVYYKANDGHFYIDALIGNVTIRFIVDTGATGMAITPSDAKKLGITVQELNFTEEYETASGTTRAAPAVIPSMLIGEFVLKNVPVSINESDSSISLMGMSVLKQFSIQIHQDQLVLSK